MANSEKKTRFAAQLLQQDEPVSDTQYKEYRMKLDIALTKAERREQVARHVVVVSCVVSFALMLVGGSRILGDFDPWSRDATILSVVLGVVYCIAVVTWLLAMASYFSRFRPRVRDIKEQIRDTAILALQCEIADLRKQSNVRVLVKAEDGSAKPAPGGPQDAPKGEPQGKPAAVLPGK